VTLSNPLSLILRLVQNLAKAGWKLSAGDLIRVGLFRPLTPPKGVRRSACGMRGSPARRRCRSTFSRRTPSGRGGSDLCPLQDVPQSLRVRLEKSGYERVYVHAAFLVNSLAKKLGFSVEIVTTPLASPFSRLAASR
jgi:hypothetical protein